MSTLECLGQEGVKTHYVKYVQQRVNRPAIKDSTESNAALSRTAINAHTVQLSKESDLPYLTQHGSES
jgi:hypothetical protein